MVFLSPMLISGIRDTQFLRGLLFAGVAIGGPLTVVLAMAVGFESPMDVFSAVVTGMLEGILCVSACSIGVGVGTAFPKFDPLSHNNKVIVPEDDGIRCLLARLLSRVAPRPVW